MHNDTICDMYPDDAAAHAAATRHFGCGDATVAGLPALYPTDAAAYAAAMDHFEGNHHDD
jgi:hypothetical protein